MSGPVPCRVCGRGFAPRPGGPLLYCARCMARVSRDVARTKRARCRECGKSFPTRNLSVHYCSDACREKAHVPRSIDRARAALPRAQAAKCRMCGKSFPTPSRAVRYCSDACRKEGYARYYHIRWRPGPARRESTVRCRVCGKDFATDMGPGKPRVYCSPPCRAEGQRAYSREYMRRYLDDPEKRAVQAVRVRESAKRRAARRRER